MHRREFDFEFLNQKRKKKVLQILFCRGLQDFFSILLKFPNRLKIAIFLDFVRRLTFLSRAA